MQFQENDTSAGLKYHKLLFFTIILDIIAQVKNNINTSIINNAIHTLILEN